MLLDQLQAFIHGKSHSNKNIITSDKQMAYVTSTGVVKPYASVDSYDKTSGMHGCPRDTTTLNKKWDSLGYAVGSQMQTGQSCGQEGKFVQSTLPLPTFDAKYYLDTHPELVQSGILNEEQAYNHWNTIGKLQGWSPNAEFPKQLQSLGKIGYIDLDTQMHPVSQNAYVYDGTYKNNTTSLQGRSMISCSSPIPLLKYGDVCLIKYNGFYMNIDDTSNMIINRTLKSWVLQPLGQFHANTPVKFGDQIILTDSLSCGDNCKVAYYNKDTSTMMTGPLASGTAFYILPAEGSSYASQSVIQHGTPFIFQYVPNDEYEYKKLSGLDTGGNDIGAFTNKRVEDCESLCDTTPGCSGFVYLDSGQRCWLKNNRMYPIGPGKSQPNNNLSIRVRNKVLTKKAYIPMNENKITFGDTGHSFISMPLSDTLSMECNLSELQQKCNQMRDCIGFIHSPSTHTWQAMSSSPTTNQITSEERKQTIYLKKATASLAGCPSTTEWTDASQFSNYVQGSEYEANVKGQCKMADVSSLEEDVNAFKEQNNQRMKTGQRMVNQYNQLDKSTQMTYQQLGQQNKKGQQQLQEYQHVKKSMKNISENPTANQQNVDSQLMTSYYNQHIMLWGTAAVVIMAILVSRKL
jgi:hypothetical protein